jgi:DNA-directed RNA polymerase subunit RPC12/RpoP
MMTTSLDTFAPIAARYRRLNRTALTGIAVFMVAAPVVTFLHLRSRWVTVIILALWSASIVAMILAHTCLKCPKCAVSLDRTNGPFCPECGSRALSEGRFWSFPACTQCGCTLRNGKGRTFRIRYCNHCGSHLDVDGL